MNHFVWDCCPCLWDADTIHPVSGESLRKPPENDEGVPEPFFTVTPQSSADPSEAQAEQLWGSGNLGRPSGWGACPLPAPAWSSSVQTKQSAT